MKFSALLPPQIKEPRGNSMPNPFSTLFGMLTTWDLIIGGLHKELENLWLVWVGSAVWKEGIGVAPETQEFLQHRFQIKLCILACELASKFKTIGNGSWNGSGNEFLREVCSSGTWWIKNFGTQKPQHLVNEQHLQWWKHFKRQVDLDS